MLVAVKTPDFIEGEPISRALSAAYEIAKFAPAIKSTVTKIERNRFMLRDIMNSKGK
jgi:hypothetical protein